MAIVVSPHFAVHPGQWLREAVVAPRGLSITQLASHIGVSRQALSMLLNGHTGRSADMAIRLEKAFGLMADTLCRMQTAYELAEARRSQDTIAVVPWPDAA